MLQDISEDHKETWFFLDRRIKDALQVHAVLSAKPSPDEALSYVTEMATSVFVTVNILPVFIFYNILY